MSFVQTRTSHKLRCIEYVTVIHGWHLAAWMHACIKSYVLYVRMRKSYHWKSLLGAICCCLWG